MLKHEIEFRVCDEMDLFLRSQAKRRDESVGQVLRGLINKDMKRLAAAKTPNRADEQLVARLQRLLVPAMASALGWNDLERRLAALSYKIKPAGGGLTVHDLATGARLCKSSELGFPYARSVRKFGCPMPRHPHKMGHITTALRDVPQQDGAEDFDVIERFNPFSEPAHPASRQSAPR